VIPKSVQSQKPFVPRLGMTLLAARNGSLFTRKSVRRPATDDHSACGESMSKSGRLFSSTPTLTPSNQGKVLNLVRMGRLELPSQASEATAFSESI
jgi:hypothetical protein